MSVNKLKIRPSEWDSVFNRISWWDSEAVKNTSVMVVGAGALGNEVLKNLALLNVGKITIIDFDKIEYPNLSRSVLFRESDVGLSKAKVAASRIQEINPNINVQIIEGDVDSDVGLGVFRRSDVIIGCVDNRIARLAINRKAFRLGKSWVDGAIENLSGEVNLYIQGLNCYECQLSDNDWVNIRNRLGCTDIAMKYASYGTVPTTPLSASIIGAIMVQEALKSRIHNSIDTIGDQKNRNTIRYEGLTNDFYKIRPKDPNQECNSHFVLDKIIEATPLSNESSVSFLFEWLKLNIKSNQFQVKLSTNIILEVQLGEKTIPLLVPQHKLDDKLRRSVDADTLENSVPIITQSTFVIEESFSSKNLTLESFGIPPLEVLTIICDQDIHYIELSKDNQQFNKINQ